MITKKDKKTVLVFDERKRAMGIHNSVTSTAKIFNTTVQSIHYACTGRCISCEGRYFRYMEPPITINEFFEMDLIQYDKLCGVERKVYNTPKMSRVGMKYNTKKKSTL